MTKKICCSLWAVLFIVCAALGFIPQPEGGLKTLELVLSLLFFLPPFLLLAEGVRQKHRPTLQLIRNLSLASLLLSLAAILLNIVCAAGPQLLGDILNALLILVSTPMISSGHWALSLFLWACLLMASLMELQKKE